MGGIPEIETIGVDGLDHMGKGLLVNNLGRELDQLGNNVQIITFPDYSTPIGSLIRNILKDGIPDDIKLIPEEEVQTVMALFALNRLEILNCMIRSQFKGVYLLDRGPFSNALTISYFLKKYPDLSIEDLVNKGLEFDSFFINTLGAGNCVIQLVSEEPTWASSRVGEHDRYERGEVQDLSSSVYRYIAGIVGDGWQEVVSRDSTGWREPCDIVRACLEFAQTRCKLIKGTTSKPWIWIRDLHFPIENLTSLLYSGAKLEKSSIYDWTIAMQDNDKAEIYTAGRVITREIVSTVERIEWSDISIKDAVGYLFERCPEIYLLLETFYGEKFMLQFMQSIYE